MLLSSSNLKYPPLHCFHIFPWLCAWDVCYIIFCHLLDIHSGKTGNLFALAFCSLWCSVQIVGYVFGLQIVFVCLCITPSHYHHFANFIWRHWTYWARLSIFFQLSIIQYAGLCVFSLPISFVMIEIIYILFLIIIINSEVWRTITHCLGLGHETMVNAVCLSIFLLLSLSL